MSTSKSADSQYSLEELPPVSTKRRRTEDLSLSQLQIEDNLQTPYPYSSSTLCLFIT